MAIINGNDTIFGTLNGRQFFIDEAFEAEEPSNLPEWLPQQNVLQSIITDIFENNDIAEKTNYLMFAYTTDVTDPQSETVNYSVIIGWIISNATVYRFTDANNRCFTARKQPFDSPYNTMQFTIKWAYNPNTSVYEWQLVSATPTEDQRLYIMTKSDGESYSNHLIALIEKGSAVTYTTDLPSYVNWIDLTI